MIRNCIRRKKYVHLSKRCILETQVETNLKYKSLIDQNTMTQNIVSRLSMESTITLGLCQSLILEKMARDLEEYLQEIGEMEREARQERDRFFIEQYH